MNTGFGWCFGGMATVRQRQDSSFLVLDLPSLEGGIPDFTFDFGYISPPLYTSPSSFRPADFSRSPIVYRRDFRFLLPKRHKFPSHNGSHFLSDGF